MTGLDLLLWAVLGLTVFASVLWAYGRGRSKGRTEASLALLPRASLALERWEALRCSPVAGSSLGSFGSGDVSEGIVVSATGGALVPLGLSPGQIEGRPLGDLSTPEFVAAVGEARAGRSHSYTTRFRDASGRRRAYLAAVFPVTRSSARVAAGAILGRPLEDDEVLVGWDYMDATAMQDEAEDALVDRIIYRQSVRAGFARTTDANT